MVPDDPPVVFTHPDGFLETVVSAVKRDPEVRLQAWSRIEGRALVAGQPKGGVRINLSTLHWSPSAGFQLIYSATSNPDGSFVFDADGNPVVSVRLLHTASALVM